jgi:RNA polymerase sigma factor (sigma-70 family)
MPADATLGRRNDVLPAVLLRLASDRRLVEQVHAGSERAFEALFDRHHRPVLAFCRHMLGSKEEAEDVVQLTFLAAYRDLGRAEPPAALRPWLYAIARHRCLSVLRARRERPVAEVALPAADRLAADVAMREDLRTVLDDVARLPDDQRAALVLAELGDVSHEEIARILGCPREKVKALVFQARSSLLASRVARDTPCADIREQLSTLRGGALRRTTLRRHLRECEACRAFREQVRGQRRALGLLLPVAPGIGLKRVVLTAILGPNTDGAGGTAFTAGALSSGGLAAALVVVAIPGGGVTAAAKALGGRDDGPRATPIVQQAEPVSAWSVQHADQRRLQRAEPGSRAPRPNAGARGPRPVQASGTREARPADGPGRREPARPQQAVTSAPSGARAPAAPATPVEADERRPPGSTPAPAKAAKVAKPAKPESRPIPAAPARPTRPPQGHGGLPPATPATPATPAQAGGRTTPATGAGPSTPPQANGQATPPQPNGGAHQSPAAAPGATPGPAGPPPASGPPRGAG